MSGALFFLIVALLFAIWVTALVGAIRSPSYAYQGVGRSKAVTVILVLLTGFIGGTYFLLRIRPGLQHRQGAGPPTGRVPVDTADIKEWRRTRDPWA